MNIRGSILLLCIAGAAVLVGCTTMIFGSTDYESINNARALEQTHFEDSSKVFFATFSNPYPDKEFLWFAVFAEGVVEMHVHDAGSDSLESIYRFEKQRAPVHTVAMHQRGDHFVKCVLFVDGHMKCAKLYPSWSPLTIPQFKTQYTIDAK